jgi:STE24 endopeptidase
MRFRVSGLRRDATATAAQAGVRFRSKFRTGMISINTFLGFYLLLYVLSGFADVLLNLLNAASLRRHGNKVPSLLTGWIDKEKLAEIRCYLVDKTRLTVAETVTVKALFLAIVLAGPLPWLAEGLGNFPEMAAGLIFFAIIGLSAAILGLPFDWYHAFVIEEKYGFNTKTFRTWASDLVKSFCLTMIMGGTLAALLLLIVKAGGTLWWIWAWLVFFAFQVLISAIYPTVIAPIFNRFTPLEDGELAAAIERFAEPQGLSVKGLYQMDASKRTRHTNAFLAGLGRTKRIVLFDSLLQSHENDEIVAILAHEVGHLKGGHIKKSLILMGGAALIFFYLTFQLMRQDILYDSFAFSENPAYVGLFLVFVLWAPLQFFLSPLGLAISRSFERGADRYACTTLGDPAALTNALKKMARDNLSNLQPHPLFVWFNYSHPPLVERLMRLHAIHSEEG